MLNEGDARRAESLPTEQRDGHVTERADECALPVDCSVSCEVLAKAVRWERRGKAWRREHVDAWRAFEQLADQCIEERRPLSSNDIGALVLDREFVSSKTGERTTLNRTLSPLFIRWLVSERPGLVPLVKLRASFFDVLRDCCASCPYSHGCDGDGVQLESAYAPDLVDDLIDLMNKYPQGTCADALDYWYALLGEDEYGER